MDRDQTILTEDGSSEEPPKVFMCERCKVALKRIELKGLYQVEVHKCMACGNRRTRKAKDLAIRSSPILEEKDV